MPGPQPVYADGAILGVELTSRVFRAVADTIGPEAGTARQHIIAALVNAPLQSNTVVNDLATMAGTSPLFVEQIL